MRTHVGGYAAGHVDWEEHHPYRYLCLAIGTWFQGMQSGHLLHVLRTTVRGLRADLQAPEHHKLIWKSKLRHPRAGNQAAQGGLVPDRLHGKRELDKLRAFRGCLVGRWRVLHQ